MSGFVSTPTAAARDVGGEGGMCRKFKYCFAVSHGKAQFWSFCVLWSLSLFWYVCAFWSIVFWSLDALWTLFVFSLFFVLISGLLLSFFSRVCAPDSTLYVIPMLAGRGHLSTFHERLRQQLSLSTPPDSVRSMMRRLRLCDVSYKTS